MPSEVNHICDTLWMGSYNGPLYVPKPLHLHIHCAYELPPIKSGAHRTLWLKLDDANIDWRQDRSFVEHVLDTAGQGVRALDNGDTVVVNCFAGRNRSGLVTALILMLAYDMPAHYAIGIIRDQRGDAAMRNMSFNRFLRAFEGAR